MLPCSDRGLTRVLTDNGYSIPQVPNPQLKPLSVLIASGQRTRLIGEASDLWHPKAEEFEWPTPHVHKPEQWDVEVLVTDQLDASVALKFLHGLGVALGLGGLSRSSIAVDRDTLMRLKCEGVDRLSVPLMAIEQAATTAERPPRIPAWGDAAWRGKGSIYVVSETLRATKLAISQVHRSGHTVEAQVAPELAWNAEAAASKWNTAGAWAEFEDTKQPCPFAFKAICLRFRSGRWDSDLFRPPPLFLGLDLPKTSDRNVPGLIEWDETLELTSGG